MTNYVDLIDLSMNFLEGKVDQEVYLGGLIELTTKMDKLELEHVARDIVYE